MNDHPSATESAECRSGRSPPLASRAPDCTAARPRARPHAACMPSCAACGGPSGIHAAVLDEAAGRADLEHDGVAPLLAAVGAGFDSVRNRHAVHGEIEDVYGF
ncbi:hypothetical protein THAOC_27503 [Thalassiosira oceanica]|uniref:Uncharacterized protein n=1 Tax=Thalassiosira oceanica TaxID=159749 RepID=K0RLG5_THAOC|nr:hypothetical protein THAOC_27503 [Thalassiosira oceanica]|eukprot:EJK53119.1 hypothetical protein THAOC_27503 [Thalassiosira oceanica]